MTAIVLFSLLVLALSQNCPIVSQYCNPNSCSYTTTGAVNCTSCANNTFSIPMAVNGEMYTINGNLVWACQLCSAGDTGCSTCSYDPSLPSQMFCSSCLAGYAIMDAEPYIGTCQPCGSDCLTCQWIGFTAVGCGASIPNGECGTNGLMCTQCA